MRTLKIVLGERHAVICASVTVLFAEFSLHLQDARHRGKRPCEIIKVDNLESPWKTVFGVDCVSCEDHPVSFFLLASDYTQVRKDIFNMLEQIQLRHIDGPMNAWERILDDEVV